MNVLRRRVAGSIDNEDLFQACCVVKLRLGGPFLGSAVLFRPNKALTAYHSIRDKEDDLKVNFHEYEGTSTRTIIESIPVKSIDLTLKRLDLAILTLASPSTIEPISIISLELSLEIISNDGQ